MWLRPGRSRRRLVMVLVALVCGASPAGAQWFTDARTFTLFEENDALTRTSDESYTQGLRLTWDFSQWPEWATSWEKVVPLRRLANAARGTTTKPVLVPCSPQLDRASHPCGAISVGLGQVQYTPADIIRRDREERDRPYAGWLFGSLALSVRDGPLQTSTEAVLGVIGPLSHAQSFQSLAHWTWSSGSEQPQGWDHQLRNSLHVGLVTTAAYHAFEKCLSGKCSGVYAERRVFDVTPRGEAIATTAMTRASAGLTVRAGYGFPDGLFGQRIPATAPRRGAGRDWWFAIFASGDVRAVGHNASLEGSYADDGPRNWRTNREIEARGVVNEMSLGFGVGNRAGSISYQHVTRTQEFDPIRIAGVPAVDLGRHVYASVTFSINVLP
ncbi:MAG: lipid A-modifier LpxR family protein [Gemmatimonadaceae bacterium]